MRKLRVSSVWKSPVRVSLWLKKFGPNFFINFLAELGSLENIWSDGLAVVLWWSIELYNWSRIQIFLGAQTWTVEHTNIFEEVLAHLKQHKFVLKDKRRFFFYNYTTLHCPNSKPYICIYDDQKVNDITILRHNRPWNCQLSIKYADSVQIAKCICPTLYI